MTYLVILVVQLWSTKVLELRRVSQRRTVQCIKHIMSC